MTWIDDVLQFWFDELEEADWFANRPALDAEIERRFGVLIATLVNEPPDVHRLDARGHLAAVIVLDQFSRNIHRGRADAFASDADALSIALHAIDTGLDRALPPRERRFLYMPLMHSEDAAIQDRSVAAFASLDMPDVMPYAEDHRRTIVRFGRFPSRDTALGRLFAESRETT